jgi:ATP-dependent Clp protease protease subunit
MKDSLNRILAKHTGKSEEQIAKDSDRDYFLSGEEAKEYGLVDEVIANVKDAAQEDEGEK